MRRFVVILILSLFASPSAWAEANTELFSIPTQDGSAQLNGQIDFPQGAGPHPLLIVVSGSGPQERHRFETVGKAGLRGKVSLAMVLHFDLGPEMKERLHQAGVDEVVYLRRGFLDDWRSYE